MKRKYLKFGSLLTAVLLMLGSMGAALASNVTEKVVEPFSTFTYTVELNKIENYATAQFDITIDNKNVLDVAKKTDGSGIYSWDSLITEKKPGEVNTIDSFNKNVDGNQAFYQMGFMSPYGNTFTNANEASVCTITFKYTGTTAATVTFNNLQVWRYTGEIKDGLPVLATESVEWSRIIKVSKSAIATPGTTTPDTTGGGNPSGSGQGVLGASSMRFTDVPEDEWYYEAVEYVATANIIEGTTPTTFDPNTPLTRAMFVTIIYRLAGSPVVSGTNPFTDVGSEAWYTNAVIWAAKAGIASGYTSTTFGPDDVLTREQLVTMLYRYASTKGYNVTTGQNGDLRIMTDANTISSFAQTAFAWAYAADIIHGTTPTTLSPLNTATRAEGAKMIMDFMGSFVTKI